MTTWDFGVTTVHEVSSYSRLDFFSAVRALYRPVQQSLQV